jgi:hypothetical protein
MKKVFLFCISLMMLAACSSDDDNTDVTDNGRNDSMIVGKWVCVKGTVSQTYDDGEEIVYDADYLIALNCIFWFESDNSWRCNDNGLRNSGHYTLEGNVLDIGTMKYGVEELTASHMVLFIERFDETYKIKTRLRAMLEKQ